MIENLLSAIIGKDSKVRSLNARWEIIDPKKNVIVQIIHGNETFELDDEAIEFDGVAALKMIKNYDCTASDLKKESGKLKMQSGRGKASMPYTVSTNPFEKIAISEDGFEVDGVLFAQALAHAMTVPVKAFGDRFSEVYLKNGLVFGTDGLALSIARVGFDENINLNISRNAAQTFLRLFHVSAQEKVKIDKGIIETADFAIKYHANRVEPPGYEKVVALDYSDKKVMNRAILLYYLKNVINVAEVCTLIHFCAETQKMYLYSQNDLLETMGFAVMECAGEYDDTMLFVENDRFLRIVTSIDAEEIVMLKSNNVLLLTSLNSQFEHYVTGLKPNETMMEGYQKMKEKERETWEKK